MNACQVTPNQNIWKSRPTYKSTSREVRSAGIVRLKQLEAPKRTFIQLLKKKVGPKRYKKKIRKRQRAGKRSKKNEKNRISDTNIIEPGKPKKTRVLTRAAIKSFGHRKFNPLISVIKRVLKRRLIASTKKKELVDSKAWLISIAKLANMRADWPLTIQMVSQCISITVE